MTGYEMGPDNYTCNGKCHVLLSLYAYVSGALLIDGRDQKEPMITDIKRLLLISRKKL